MKTRFEPLTIHGLGLATGVDASAAPDSPPGTGQQQVFRGHKRFFDRSFNPLVCAFADRDDIAGFVPRVTDLAADAIVACLGQITHVAPGPTRLSILLPASDAALPDASIQTAARAIEAEVRNHLGANLAGVTLHVGTATALGSALGTASESGVPFTLIVAADSYCDRARLEAALRAGQLMSRRNQWGFVPGEAAGAVLVGPQDDAGIALIDGLGLAQEPVPETDLTRESDFVALSHAVRDACADMDDERLAGWFADLNNARYRATEVAHAILRATPFWLTEDVMPETPAAAHGDCGTATGLLALEMALKTGGGSLLSLGGGGTVRAAIRVTAPPAK